MKWFPVTRTDSFTDDDGGCEGATLQHTKLRAFWVAVSFQEHFSQSVVTG